VTDVSGLTDVSGHVRYERSLRGQSGMQTLTIVESRRRLGTQTGPCTFWALGRRMEPRWFGGTSEPAVPREGGSWRRSFSSLHRTTELLSTKQTGEPRRRPAGSGHVCLGRPRRARLRDDRRRHPRRRPRHRFGLALGARSLFQRSPRRRAGSGSRSWCGGERALTRSASRLKLRTRPTARESGRSRRTQQQ
jgi:hypothetical protein